MVLHILQHVTVYYILYFYTLLHCLVHSAIIFLYLLVIIIRIKIYSSVESGASSKDLYLLQVTITDMFDYFQSRAGIDYIETSTTATFNILNSENIDK